MLQCATLRVASESKCLKTRAMRMNRTPNPLDQAASRKRWLRRLRSLSHLHPEHSVRACEHILAENQLVIDEHTAEDNRRVEEQLQLIATARELVLKGRKPVPPVAPYESLGVFRRADELRSLCDEFERAEQAGVKLRGGSALDAYIRALEPFSEGDLPVDAIKASLDPKLVARPDPSNCIGAMDLLGAEVVRAAHDERSDDENWRVAVLLLLAYVPSFTCATGVLPGIPWRATPGARAHPQRRDGLAWAKNSSSLQPEVWDARLAFLLESVTKELVVWSQIEGHQTKERAPKEVQLTEVQICVLRFMYKHRALRSDARMSADLIAEKALRQDGSTVRKSLTALAKRGLLDSKRNRGGGYWLTELGAARGKLLAEQP